MDKAQRPMYEVLRNEGKVKNHEGQNLMSRGAIINLPTDKL